MDSVVYTCNAFLEPLGSHWGGTFLCLFCNCLRPLFVFTPRCIWLYYIMFHVSNRPTVICCILGRNQWLLNYTSHGLSSTVFPARRRLPISSSKVASIKASRATRMRHPVVTFKTNLTMTNITLMDHVEGICCVVCCAS